MQLSDVHKTTPDPCRVMAKNGAMAPLIAFALVVMTAVGGECRAAHALGSATLDVAVVKQNYTSAPTLVPNIDGAAPSAPKLTAPEDLPPLVREQDLGPERSSAQDVSKRYAMELQILWRHSRQDDASSSWFRVEQSKKHAAMTGRSQMLVLVIAFLLMSSVTALLWRQVGSCVPGRNGRRTPPRRLR